MDGLSRRQSYFVGRTAFLSPLRQSSPLQKWRSASLPPILNLREQARVAKVNGPLRVTRPLSAAA
jgi:hypothetical protein